MLVVVVVVEQLRPFVGLLCGARRFEADFSKV
jgi:hypothetical protein